MTGTGTAEGIEIEASITTGLRQDRFLEIVIIVSGIGVLVICLVIVTLPWLAAKRQVQFTPWISLILIRIRKIISSRCTLGQSCYGIGS